MAQGCWDRQHLRHGYKNVDDHEMWDIASTDLAALKTTIQRMMLEVGSEIGDN